MFCGRPAQTTIAGKFLTCRLSACVRRGRMEFLWEKNRSHSQNGYFPHGYGPHGHIHWGDVYDT